jgi:hypothetical protein
MVQTGGGMKRKIPPFAKDFKPINLGEDCNLAIINFGWTKKSNGTVVVPPEESPDKFHWNFLRGCFVVCRGDASELFRVTLALELKKIGVISVRFILPATWHEFGHNGIYWGSDHVIY